MAWTSLNFAMLRRRWVKGKTELMGVVFSIDECIVSAGDKSGWWKYKGKEDKVER
jgi:hypothetical protein